MGATNGRKLGRVQKLLMQCGAWRVPSPLVNTCTIGLILSLITLQSKKHWTASNHLTDKSTMPGHSDPHAGSDGQMDRRTGVVKHNSSKIITFCMFYDITLTHVRITSCLMVSRSSLSRKN